MSSRAMVNGDGESRNEAVMDRASELESTPGSVAGAAPGEAPSGVQDEHASTFPPGQTWAREDLEDQTGGDNIKTANEESLAVSEAPLDREANPPEEVSLDSVSDVPANGPAEVGSEKGEIVDGWNNGLPNGIASGWASADPPGEERTRASGEGGASHSGVLGSAPAAAPAGMVEQPPQQHRFTYYMIRIPRPADDTSGKADISNAEWKFHVKADERDQHNFHVQAAKSKRNEAFQKRGPAREFEAQCLRKLREKFQELKPLRDSLKRTKDEGRSMLERNQSVPRSEEDLDYRIASVKWRMQHESIPLKEEKQLMREMKALEASRESVRQMTALRPLNEQYKQLEAEFKAASSLRESADLEYEKQNEALTSVLGLWHKANDLRQEAYETRRDLKQQEYSRLKEFYDNRREIQQARDIACQPKSRKAVEEYCNAQLERVMGLWMTNEGFRKNYVKDNERSTVRRLETLDGRTLGPEERPPTLSSVERSAAVAVPEQQSKASAKENGLGGGIADGGAEEVEEKKPKPVTAMETKKEVLADADMAIPVAENSSEEVKPESADLKERRRAAEMAKAKEAEERKKRIAEKAQVKAQAWAQKEAERKEKEREKRARKKAASVSSAEPEGLKPLEGLKPSEGTGEAASNESAPEVDVARERKVSSKQRKRGLTSSAKADKRPLPHVRRARKVFGLSVASLVGIGAVALIFVAIAILMLYKASSRQRDQFERGE